MGRLNEAKLCNFPEIDVFCLVSNEDHSMIKPKTFHVPVVTPYELELGIVSLREEKRFRSFASDLFSITCPQVWALMTGTHTIWVVIRVLICRRVSRLWLLKLSNLGKFIVNIGKEFFKNLCMTYLFIPLFVNNDETTSPEDPIDLDDSEGEAVFSEEGMEAIGHSQSQLIRRNQEDRLMNLFRSAAGDRFLQREYQGLSYDVPDQHDLTIKQGVFGIAASYVVKEKEADSIDSTN